MTRPRTSTSLWHCDPTPQDRRASESPVALSGFSKPTLALIVSMLVALTPLVVPAGCASQDGFVPGRSTRRPEAPNVPPTAAVSASGPWEQAASIPSFQPIDDRQLPSNHHAPEWSSIVRANEVAAPSYAGRGVGESMPTGSILVDIHQDPASGKELPIYAMVKREPGFDTPFGDWEYLVLHTSGRLESRGNARDMSPCARCHADAPGDHVFGPRAASSKRPAHASSAGTLTDDPAAAPDEDETAVGKPSSGKPPRKKKK